jgi:hypothetical protein
MTHIFLGWSALPAVYSSWLEAILLPAPTWRIRWACGAAATSLNVRFTFHPLPVDSDSSAKAFQ